MTRAEQGSVALDGDTFHVAPAFKVKVVDGTGAGDVFRAGFIYALLTEVAGARACFASRMRPRRLSCTRLGAIPSVPTLDEVDALLSQRRSAQDSA